MFMVDGTYWDEIRDTWPQLPLKSPSFTRYGRKHQKYKAPTPSLESATCKLTSLRPIGDNLRTPMLHFLD